MKNLTLVIMSLIFISCGMNVEKKNVLKIDPAFSQYVDRFESTGGKQIKNLEFVFGDTSYLDRPGEFTVYGFCQKGTVQKQKLLVTEVYEIRKIVINPRIWATLTAADKEQLAFHELGHCVLERGHKNDLIGGRSASIMHQYHNEVSRSYTASYNYYMKELFNKQNLVASWDASFYDNLASSVFQENSHTSEETSNTDSDTQEFEEIVPHESEMTDDGCVHDFGHVVVVDKNEETNN